MAARAQYAASFHREVRLAAGCSCAIRRGGLASISSLTMLDRKRQATLSSSRTPPSGGRYMYGTIESRLRSSFSFARERAGRSATKLSGSTGTRPYGRSPWAG